MSDVAASGRFFTVRWAENKNGKRVAYDYFNKKLNDRQKARMLVLFKRLATQGRIENRQHFKPFKDGLFEFKDFQIRIIGAFTRDREFLLAAGVTKKKDKLDQKDLDKAQRVLREHQERKKRRGEE